MQYAVRLLGHDPRREDTHRLVMRCHVRLAGSGRETPFAGFTNRNPPVI